MSTQTELQALYARHGVLRAEDVVEFARNPKTALHSAFTWDDGAAAREWRLLQARNIIRVHVTVLDGAQEEYRVWVSLESDRKQAGGGYRALVDVMGDAKMRRQLLQQAQHDFKAWQRKYQQLRELEPVFAAMERVEHGVDAPALQLSTD